MAEFQTQAQAQLPSSTETQVQLQSPQNTCDSLHEVKKSDSALCLSSKDIPKVIIAFDIEARGPSAIRHGILAIGWCVRLANDFSIIERDFVALEELIPGQFFEPRCYNEFWSKNRGILEKLSREVIPARDAIAKFYDMLVTMGKKYKVILITDNPAFDAWMLQYYMDYFGYPPLHYESLPDKQYGGYRTVHDTNSYARGVMEWDYLTPTPKGGKDKQIKEKFQLDIVSIPTHLPHDDAEYISEFHLRLMQKVTERSKKRRLADSNV